jgi:hypothetical protein
MDDINLEIAGIGLSISIDRPSNDVRLGEAYRDFTSPERQDIHIRAHYNGLPVLHISNMEKVFDSGMIWSLYRSGLKNVFVLKSPVYGPRPYRVAVFSDDFHEGDVYTSPEMAAPEDGLLSDPLEFPLCELMMISLLARGLGVLVHACAVKDGERGYLFAGNSTHGKSTMARLWEDKATVLNDDRVVLRLRDGRPWIYGTPWHGDYSGVSRDGARLDRIFFLRHADGNTLQNLDATASTGMLLARCFPQLWDSGGMRFTLDFCARAAGMVPCHELGFVPDESIVDFVRCAT